MYVKTLIARESIYIDNNTYTYIHIYTFSIKKTYFLFKNKDIFLLKSTANNR